MDLATILPEQLDGWTAHKTVPLKNHTDMFNYMDGAAELYISYGFGEALSCTYYMDGQPEVLAEVFDLLAPRNAFGVFTQTRESEISQFGQGTYRIPGALFFWKERYYIALSAWESNSVSDTFVDALAGHIDQKIAGTGIVPAIVDLLPETDRIPYGYKYFHHYVWQNAYFFISDQNLFLIDADADAVMARYAEGDDRNYLLLIRYVSSEKAGEAFALFGREFFPGGLTGNCIRRDDGRWMAAATEGGYLMAVFNASIADRASGLLDAVLRNVRS
ncbi:MAG: hypothetical protein JXQ80_03125 [Bacteroidales bacterium]|nr:hypothetical protein [Bacteroidales bacterium]